MIILIAGKPGVGKTALMTYFAILDMTINAYESVQRTNRFINELNAGGYNFKPAKGHLVYSNYDIKSHMKGYVPRRSYGMEGYEFGLPDDKHPTKLVYRYSSLFFTEAQAFLNSRNYRSFRDSVSRAYEQHRHWDLNIYLDAQRATLIDLNVRELSQIIYVEKLDIKQDRLGKVKRCVWHCKLFNDIKDYDKFNESGKDFKSAEVVYKYDGNIFKCYDSQMNMPLFLQGAKGKQFYNKKYEDVGTDYASIEKFCKTKSIANIESSGYTKK